MDIDYKKYEGYEEKDSKENPAYIFCTQEITTIYGTCPHLSLEDADKRKVWLEATHDAGKAYADLYERLVNASKVTEIEQEIANDRTALEMHIRQAIDEYGFVAPTTDDSTGIPPHPVEYVTESIKAYQNIKNRTNAARNDWKNVQKYIDDIFAVTGINFVKYLRLVHDISFRYRHAEGSAKINATYEQLCENLSKSQRKLLLEETFVRKKREEGVQNLLVLMEKNFETEQAGKYFKRWTLLTKEQQRERIQAFFEHYRHNNPHLQLIQEIITHAIEDVVTALATQTIKSSTVKWSMKQGTIETIDGLEFNEETRAFELAQPTKKRVTFADPTKKPKRVRKPANANSSKKKTSFSADDEMRLKRLLLVHLLDLPPTGRSQESILHAVANAFTSHSPTKTNAIAYLDSIMTRFVEDLQMSLLDAAETEHQVKETASKLGNLTIE